MPTGAKTIRGWGLTGASILQFRTVCDLTIAIGPQMARISTEKTGGKKALGFSPDYSGLVELRSRLLGISRDPGAFGS